MAPTLLSKRNSVAEIAAAKAPVKGAKGAPAPVVKADNGNIVGVDPLLLGAGWRTYLGVRALSNPGSFVKGQFEGAEDSKATKALALRCGVLNLQVAALQVAATSANMKTETKRNLHAAMAVNNFASAALAMYNAKTNGLNSTEANTRTAVTVLLGALAAAQAVKESN